MSGQFAHGDALASILQRDDVRYELGADQLEIDVYDDRGECSQQVELGQAAMDKGASVVIQKWGCDAAAAHVIDLGGLFIDIGAVSPERQPNGMFLDESEQRKFIQIGYSGTGWSGSHLNSIQLPPPEHLNWLSVPSSCDRLAAGLPRSVYGAYCYDRSWPESAVDRFKQYLDYDAEFSDADALTLAAVQIAAKISADPYEYFEYRGDYVVDTLIGRVTLGAVPRMLLPLRYIVDAEAAHNDGVGETLGRIIAQICPDCAGSTKICGTKCPDECNNSCKTENSKQCCSKSGMPLPP